jgi:hypothetical protein
MHSIKVICFPFNSIPSLSHCINATPRAMPMQAQRGGRELHPVRNLVLEGGGWSVPRCGRFALGKGPSPILHEAGCASGPVWTGAKNVALTGIRSPDRPARSEWQYRLSYADRRLKYVYIVSVRIVG